ncbi:hypothetical protein [Streptomyces sp. SPB162]|uniref:hypothetical protein n=1 Tax=Streptomyces sp. SPB162 TaxID=2940560 RepID=UPI0024060655|nr:hypothetical protein [Streptomyces sp. SPB162]MDF9816199.1 hypothetical protein [Streptomyces sp. SPB162]
MTYRRIPAAAALLAVVATGGCAPASGLLDAQDGTSSPTCRIHQTRGPADRYTAGAHADPRSVLQLMRYYTANGTKAYCDGKPPTDTDHLWTRLYTELGGSAAHLSPADKTDTTTR